MASFGSNIKSREGRLDFFKVFFNPGKLRNPSLAKLIMCFVTTTGIILGINVTSAVPITSLEPPRPASVEETFSSNDTKEGLRDSMQIASHQMNYSASLISQGPVIEGGSDNETVEYQADLILHCKALGKSETNVTWEYKDKPLSFKYATVVSEGTDDEEDFIDDHTISIDVEEPWTADLVERIDDNRVRVSARTQESSSLVGIPVGNDDSTENKIIPTNSDDKANGRKLRLKAAWVDIQLPKLNVAFYGKLTCRAVNYEGESVKEYLIIPNANSSVFMKLVRTCVALCIVAAFVGLFQLIEIYYRIKRLFEVLKI